MAATHPLLLPLVLLHSYTYLKRLLPECCCCCYSRRYCPTFSLSCAASVAGRFRFMVLLPAAPLHAATIMGPRPPAAHHCSWLLAPSRPASYTAPDDTGGSSERASVTCSRQWDRQWQFSSAFVQLLRLGRMLTNSTHVIWPCACAVYAVAPKYGAIETCSAWPTCNDS